MSWGIEALVDAAVGFGGRPGAPRGALRVVDELLARVRRRQPLLGPLGELALRAV
jgi:hypothetical protein